MDASPLPVAAELGPLLGDESLNATRDGATCQPVHAEPLPLADVLDQLYARFERGQPLE